MNKTSFPVQYNLTIKGDKEMTNDHSDCVHPNDLIDILKSEMRDKYFAQLIRAEKMLGKPSMQINL